MKNLNKEVPSLTGIAIATASARPDTDRNGAGLNVAQQQEATRRDINMRERKIAERNREADRIARQQGWK